MPAWGFARGADGSRGCLRREFVEFPAGAGEQDVVFCDVAPGDERNENDDHETGADILGSCGSDLLSG